MSIGRLAYNYETGKVEICRASEENMGKGRCKHGLHIKDGVEKQDFLNLVSIEQGLITDPIQIEEIRSLNKLNEKSELVHRDHSLEFGLRGKEIKKQIEAKIDDEGFLVFDGRIRQKMYEKHLGNQLKGSIVIYDQFKFLKFDQSLNPMGWQGQGLDDKDENYNYEYSSVSESIVSKFLNSIENQDSEFQSIRYEFVSAKEDGKILTGTMSNNYQYDKDNSITELILATNEETPANKAKVSKDEYIDKIMDSRRKEESLETMIEFYRRYGVEEERAKSFLIQQAAFDLITKNDDRLNNATNSIFLHDERNNLVTPFNIDYGRCLNLDFSKTTSDIMTKGVDAGGYKVDEEWIEEVSADYVDTIKSYGIFKLKSNKESIDFLLENGFEPLEINKNRLYEDLDSFIKEVEKTENKDLINFSKMKSGMFKAILEEPENKRLWKEV